MTHAPVIKTPTALINTLEAKDTLANVGNKVGNQNPTKAAPPNYIPIAKLALS